MSEAMSEPMIEPMIERLAVVGCGLIGGSFALGLRQRGLVKHIVGYGSRATSRQRALEMGVVDEACDSVAQTVAGADLVLLAVPVQAAPLTLRTLAPHLGTHAMVMDVGSTKCDVVQAARSTLGMALPRFIPAHPIAGKEVAGVEHADAQLYVQRQVFLTPLPETDARFTARARALWSVLGAQVRTLSPEAHDRAFAAVSHLPHLLAFAYIHGLMTQSDGEQLVSMGGPGFRDFSRIAASDPTVWRDILLVNRDEVLSQLAYTRQALSALEHAMSEGDGAKLHELIEAVRRARSDWRMASQAD